MIIAEFTLDHPILRETLRRHPDLQVTWEDSYPTPDGHMLLVLWLEHDDLAAVESTLDADPSVANPTVLVDLDDRRLYRFELDGEGREASIMPLLAEVGGVQLKLSAGGEGWRNRVRFPDRGAFERLYRFCLDHDIEFTFERIYEQSERFGGDGPELTAAQYEVLVEAVDSGYFEIPRACSLSALGERLGISESAASERLRRAMKQLVQQTIYPA